MHIEFVLCIYMIVVSIYIYFLCLYGFASIMGEMLIYVVLLKFSYVHEEMLIYILCSCVFVGWCGF